MGPCDRVASSSFPLTIFREGAEQLESDRGPRKRRKLGVQRGLRRVLYKAPQPQEYLSMTT